MNLYQAVYATLKALRNEGDGWASKWALALETNYRYDMDANYERIGRPLRKLVQAGVVMRYKKPDQKFAEYCVKAKSPRIAPHRPYSKKEIEQMHNKFIIWEVEGLKSAKKVLTRNDF